MIDTDKYEELLENGMQHRDLWELAEELIAEVKRLRERHVAFMQWMIENYDEIVNEWEASE